MNDASPFLLRAEQLCFAHAGGAALLNGLSFDLRVGLNLVRGGDGRGKTSLLGLIAGTLQPSAGRLHRHAGTTVYFERPEDPAHDQMLARDWLAARWPRFAGWQHEVEAPLIEDFGLTPHIDKPLYMLSTGSRRKVGLVAAAASGATLTLIDMPFVALDAGSSRVLTRLLSEATAGTERAWVMADYLMPAGIEPSRLAGLVDLGD